jgi:signal transduction histidine kinase
VRRLADTVDALPASPKATALARDAGDDELGRLAAAIDRYQARLVDADVEERRYFADASHELRTPIAVVRGVTELILDDPDAHADQRRWLARLDRGMAELTGLIDALLGVARGRTSEVEDVEIGALIAEVVASVDASRGLDVRMDVDPQLRWSLPRREAQLVWRQALAALLGPDTDGALRIEATQDTLSMTFAPREPGPTPATRGDQGTGSTLVDRLARSLGWSIEHASAGDGSRSVRIKL